METKSASRQPEQTERKEQKKAHALQLRGRMHTFTDNQEHTDTDDLLADIQFDDIYHIEPPAQEEKTLDIAEIPQSVRLLQVETKEKAKKEETALPPFSLYSLIADLGDAVLLGFRFLRRVGKWLLLKPIGISGALLKILWVTLDTYALKWRYALADELRALRDEIRAIGQAMRRVGFSPIKLISVFLRGGAKTLLRHRRLLFSAGNIAMPLLAAGVLLLTVRHWNSMTFALQVQYNDKAIGYISDEAVYTKAQEMARERIDTSIGNQEAVREVMASPQYTLKLVTLNQLNDAGTICDRLIEHSDRNLTNACGIYVDDKLLCTVKNRSDAENVFNSILEPYTSGEKNVIVDFMEDISYRQGLYPDDEESMWDAAKLAARLDTPVSGEKYYSVQPGDTVYSIALEHGLTESQLEEMNPQIEEYIYEGDRLVVANEVGFVRVKIMRTENRYEEVPYTTQEINNSNMYQGDKRTVREGEAGKEQVTELVTYLDGQRISASEISRAVVEEPVSKKIEVGTKSTKVISATGTYSYSAKGFIWPAPACRLITTYFGGAYSGHRGLDFTKYGGNSTGALIVASRAGVVEYVNNSNVSFGCQVLVDHGDGYKTRYAHMIWGSICVSAGQRVEAGQTLGLVGNTGNSSGPHLHFELTYRGVLQNPLPYIS